MIDISVCDGTDCKKRNKCLRFLVLQNITETNNTLWLSFISAKECIKNKYNLFLAKDT